MNIKLFIQYFLIFKKIRKGNSEINNKNDLKKKKKKKRMGIKVK